MEARILFGRVFHCRLRPVRHAFAYPVFFLRVPGPGELELTWIDDSGAKIAVP